MMHDAFNMDAAARVRKHNKVFFCDDVPAGYAGVLYGMVNPDSGVHYVWRIKEQALSCFTQPVQMAATRDAARAARGNCPLYGWWEDGKPVFAEAGDGGDISLETERYARSSIYSRNGELVNHLVMGQKVVVIVGCGSVGSQIAPHLVRAGVRRFILVDDDCVELHNLSRTFDRSMLGSYKTKAVASSLQRINNEVSVHTFECNVQYADESFYDMLEPGNTLVIGAADNRVSDAWLCDMCANMGLDFLSCGFWDNAVVCENFVYRHGTEDHLYRCLLKESIEEDARIQHNNNYTSNDGVERKVNAGLGINVQMGNAVSAQLAVDMLMRNAEGYHAQVLPALTTQMLLFVCTNNPALGGENVGRWFKRPLWSQCCKLTPSAGCTCHAGDAEEDLTGLDLDGVLGADAMAFAE